MLIKFFLFMYSDTELIQFCEFCPNWTLSLTWQMLYKEIYCLEILYIYIYITIAFVNYTFNSLRTCLYLYEKY